MVKALEKVFDNEVGYKPIDDSWVKNSNLKQTFIDAVLNCYENIDKLRKKLYNNKSSKKPNSLNSKYSVKNLDKMKKTLERDSGAQEQSRFTGSERVDN